VVLKVFTRKAEALLREKFSVDTDTVCLLWLLWMQKSSPVNPKSEET
jgi:hypothetical protein